MAFQVRAEGDTTIVALSGDIDLDNSPLVRNALLESVGERRLLHRQLRYR
jgi:anti-anti-sigma regulatory factor